MAKISFNFYLMKLDRSAGYLCAEVKRRPETSHTPVRELGIRRITADVWTFNDPARAFFRKCGLTAYIERLWLEEATPDGSC